MSAEWVDAAVVLAVVVGVGVWRRRRARRRWIAARVEQRIREGGLERDVVSLRRALREEREVMRAEAAAVNAGAVVDAAERVLDEALAAVRAETEWDGGPADE